MNPAAKSSSETLLDAMIHSITQHPRNLLIVILLIVDASYSWVSLLWSLVVGVVLRCIKVPLRYAALSATVLLFLVWLMDGLDPWTVHRQSLASMISLWNSSAINHPLYIMISALPFGLLFGCLLSWIMRWKLGLEGELKRVAKGQHAHNQKPFRAAKLQKALAQIKSAAKNEATVFGIDVYTAKPVQLSDVDANLHTLAIGTTGCGKTTGLANLIESAIHRRYPLIYVDGKGDLPFANRIERYCKQQGVPFYLFSMTGQSLKYNPIAYGGYTSKKDRIVELRHWSEDHYRKIAEGYLQTVFKILERNQLPMDLYSLANNLNPNAIYDLAREKKNAVLVEEAERLESQVKDISSLIAEIENMARSEIGELFDCRTGEVLTLDNALSKKAIVYFCLQPLAFPAYAETLGKLIINDIKALAASLLAKTQKVKLYTIFDEFSVFAGDQVINLINQGRGAGIHAVLSTQSLSDISKKGGDALLGQVLNNVNNYLIQRQNNPADAEILASLIGTEEGFEVTSQISTQPSHIKSGTVRQSREFIIHPDEIKRLGLGEAIYVNKQKFRVSQILLRQGLIR